MNVMSNGQSVHATNTAAISIATTSDCTSIEEDGSSTETALKSEGNPDESSETAANVIATLPSTSDTQSNAESSASSQSSSAKRKAALPRKRPYLSDQRLTISADTGEVLDDDTNARICVTTNNNNMHSYRSKRVKSIDKRMASNRCFKRPNSAFAGTINDLCCDNDSIRASNESRSHSVSCLYEGSAPASDKPITNYQSAIPINQNSHDDFALSFRADDSLNEVESAANSVQNGWNCGTLQDLLNNPLKSISSFSMANGLVDASALDSVGLGTATSLLPFLSSHFSELSTDSSQSMQMALLEAATAAANSTISGIFGNASRSAAQMGNPVPKSTQESGVASTSSDVSSDLLQSVLNNTSDYLTDSLCLAMPLPQTAVGTTPNMSREDRIDLEELEVFAHNFKKQRIKFGFTQGDVGLALGRRYGTDFSQTTISRFEALNLSFKNMCKLRPLLKEWLSGAESAIASGATVNDLLDVNKADPPSIQPGNVLPLLVATPIEGPSPSMGSSGLAVRKRRKRTNFDSAQRAALDKSFQITSRPDHDSMALIATVLELDRDVVRVWFCNRRQKLRRA